MKEVVIVSACRTAIGKFGGGFKDTPAVELGAVVIAEASNALASKAKTSTKSSWATSFRLLRVRTRLVRL